MPFCPNCRAEYVEGISTCADCQVPLVAELPPEEESSGLACSHCGGEVEATTPYCPRCGYIFEEDVTCPNHPEAEAVAHCVICHRVLCEDDVIENGIHAVCKEHQDVELIEDDAMLYQTHEEVEVGLIEAALRADGLNPTIVPPGAGGQAIVGNVALAVFSILVPFDEYLKAVTLTEQVLIENAVEMPEEEEQ